MEMNSESAAIDYNHSMWSPVIKLHDFFRLPIITIERIRSDTPKLPVAIHLTHDAEVSSFDYIQNI